MEIPGEPVLSFHFVSFIFSWDSSPASSVFVLSRDAYNQTASVRNPKSQHSTELHVHSLILLLFTSFSNYYEFRFQNESAPSHSFLSFFFLLQTKYHSSCFLVSNKFLFLRFCKSFQVLHALFRTHSLPEF